MWGKRRQRHEEHMVRWCLWDMTDDRRIVAQVDEPCFIVLDRVMAMLGAAGRSVVAAEGSPEDVSSWAERETACAERVQSSTPHHLGG